MHGPSDPNEQPKLEVSQGSMTDGHEQARMHPLLLSLLLYCRDVLNIYFGIYGSGFMFSGLGFGVLIRINQEAKFPDIHFLEGSGQI